MFLKVIFDL